MKWGHDEAMEKKKKMLPECYTEHHLLNAVFLIEDSAVSWATVSPSVLTDTVQCSSESRSGLCLVQLLNSSGSDDEIFLVAESGMKSALFSSLTPFSKGWALPRFCIRSLEKNCWPQINHWTVRKKELWHLYCHIVHVRRCCALGPILLCNWTYWCPEMHPAVVLKYSEPFESILLNIYWTFVSSANWVLSSTVDLTLAQQKFKSYITNVCVPSLQRFTLRNCCLSHILHTSRDLPLPKGIFCCVRIWHEIWLKFGGQSWPELIQSYILSVYTMKQNFLWSLHANGAFEDHTGEWELVSDPLSKILWQLSPSRIVRCHVLGGVHLTEMSFYTASRNRGHFASAAQRTCPQVFQAEKCVVTNTFVERALAISVSGWVEYRSGGGWVGSGMCYVTQVGGRSSSACV